MVYFSGGSILFNGGAIAMSEDCCCPSPCQCDAGTLPTSMDVYFENCTSYLACLEGMTVNLPQVGATDNPYYPCYYSTGRDGCICDDVQYIDLYINPIGGPPTQRFLLVIQLNESCGGTFSGNQQAQQNTDLTAFDCLEEVSDTITFVFPSSGQADYTVTPIA